MTARRIYGIWDARTAPKSSRYCFARQQCCVCRVGRLKPFHRIAVISTAKRWMKRKSARNANYRCYRTSRVIFFFFFFHNNAFDVEKHRNNLNAEGRDYYEIKTPAHICIHRATLFTRTLQTMHYHFKAGQVWFLVHTWKTGWKLCLSGYIPLYFCSLGCKLRARGPP